MVDASLVDGILTTALGNDSGPRQRETVGLGTERLEKCNILGGAVIGVTGRLARATINDLSGNLGESIPDTRATTILLDSSLDLVAISRQVCQSGTLISIDWSRYDGTTYEAVAKPQMKSLGRAAMMIVSVWMLD